MITTRAEFLACFEGCAGDTVPYVADLTLWLDWQRSRGTLPAEWQDYTPRQIAEMLGTPLWQPVRPWRLEMPDVEVIREEREGERSLRYRTAAGELQARWTLGPDGDWWQSEYLIKTAADLPAARQLVTAYRYVLDAAAWQPWQDEAAQDVILALELPKTPYSELLHTWIGWSEGFMLLAGDEREPLLELLDIMEAQYRELVVALAHLPGALVLAPDNLDGQFITPTAFREHMANTYRFTTETLHAQGKRLIVHLGGMGRHLLRGLADAGVDGIEGVAGPPQSDTPLPLAREKVGPSVVLWGGIPQDYLLATQPEEELRKAVVEAVQWARADGRVILGVADRVPAQADWRRLRILAEMVRA
ncbi:MAG: uroporphyrinogen decarboxylase family protein [Anaerolineae bacterium]